MDQEYEDGYKELCMLLLFRLGAHKEPIEVCEQDIVEFYSHFHGDLPIVLSKDVDQTVLLRLATNIPDPTTGVQ